MKTLGSKPRVAIYGRHSTDKQNPSSSADQIAACQTVVDFLNGEVVATYIDPEVSGYRRDRPGLKRLLREAADGQIDIVVAEALDRLARDPEDVAWIGKKLRFDRVQLWTIAENEIDDVKFAVAGMLGSLFLSQLRQKVHRGLSAAVLAGRFAGGRAYGYRKVTGFDDRDRPLTGLLEIAPEEAEQVRQIFQWFASGLSSIQIAKRLNLSGVPGPRGGQWNASTIRGDPAKLVGILNNPLYRGELVWNRREWRKNPDSDRRERLYRLRNESEWLRIEVPDLRIIDEALWEKVRREMAVRRRPLSDNTSTRSRRRKHLLSGLIKCGKCGANYTIAGKDYYRCAGVKERATCANRVSVRVSQIERATLSVLQHGLINDEHARIFVEAFRMEAARIARQERGIGALTQEALGRVTEELANLERNMLSGVLSPTLQRLLAEREAEKARLEAQLAIKPPPLPTADILPHPALLQRFKAKVHDLQSALSDEAIRVEAVEVIAQLIEAVTIHGDNPAEPEVEITARLEALMSYAANENSPLAGPEGCSVSVVAGVGFEPTTFRL